MAFTERYVKVQSTRWDTATTYVVNDQCSGSDNKNYYCIKNQSSAEGADPPAAGYDEWWTVSDGTTEVRAWTFAEMIAAAPAAGTRVNIKAGSYSVGTTTLPVNGTINAPIVLRGYSSSIGDLDANRRGSDGLLDTTNMPDITITGLWTPQNYIELQNLDITGDLPSFLIGGTTYDIWGMYSCRVVNSQNNSSAGCVQGDDNFVVVNCDFSCTGASHSNIIDADNGITVIACVFSGTLNTSEYLRCNYGNILGCTFKGVGNTSKAIVMAVVSSAPPVIIKDNTIYNFGTAIEFANNPQQARALVINNHITDCGVYLSNPYSATAEWAIIEGNNRTRDNTTPRTGILSSILSCEVTTDAGNSTTDYVSASDLRLLPTAAGANVGMILYTDIGAARHSDPAAAGGGTASGFPRRVMKLG